MVEILYKNIKEKVPIQIDKIKTGSLVILEEPTEEEVDEVTKMLNLDEGLMQDAKDPHEVPHIEKEDGVTYLFTRMPYEQPDANAVTTHPAIFVIGSKFVCIIFHKKTVILDSLRSGSIDYATTQKTKLVFQVMSEINSIYSRFIVRINKGVRKATVDFRSISNKDIINFLHFESTLNDFLSALVATNSTLNHILSGRYIEIYESDEDLIEDNLLANGQLIETARSNLKNIFNIRDAYSTIMSNNLNRVIRILTALTIVLTVPTMVASFFGMNVTLPFGEGQIAFWIIVVFTLGLSLALLGLFAKNKWL